MKEKFKTIKELEKEVEIAKQVKFRNCLVCEKIYPLRQSDTKRYCLRKCSDIAMRIRNWENNRGMDLRVKEGKLSQTKQIYKIIDKIPDIKNGVGYGCNNDKERTMFRLGYKNGRYVFKSQLKGLISDGGRT